MDKTEAPCPDCSHEVHAAFADLRSYITAYLRQEISHASFAALTGDVLLRYDMDIAYRKMTAQLAANMESGGSGSGRHYKHEGQPIHTASCGCEWCSQEPVGRYRGNLPDDTSAPENKAEE